MVMKDRPPKLDADMVQEFVMNAHGNYESIQTMLAETPALVNAVHDWGNGDFESAIGAAAHTGNREIALHLLANGARMDLFVAAMLGKLEVVQAIIEHFPNARHSKGAHGIPLIKHAEFGGDDAKAVLNYLKSIDA